MEFWPKAMICIFYVVSMASCDFFRKIYGKNEDLRIGGPLVNAKMYACSAKELCKHVVKYKDGKYEIFSGDVDKSIQGIESIWIKETLKSTGPVCKSAVRALGMESGAIPNEKITASSFQSHYPSYDARLNKNLSSWTANVSDTNTWIQVDLSQNMLVYSIATQGDSGVWISSYEVLYGVNGKDFARVKDSSNNVIIFPANNDSNTIVTNNLPSPVLARYIRIYPADFGSLRMELFGCDI